MAWKSKIWYCIHRRRFIGGLIMHMKVLILEEVLRNVRDLGEDTDVEEVIATITFMRDKAEEELIEETEKMFKEMGSN